MRGMRAITSVVSFAWACAGICACGGSPIGVGAPPDSAPAAAPDAAAADAPPAAHGPYPIVLVHGLFGFSEIDGLEYFYGIPELYRARGRQVFTPQLDAV